MTSQTNNVNTARNAGWTELMDLQVSSEPGQERLAMQLVGDAVRDLLPADRLERLRTAVAETVLNAIEHGHDSQAECLVSVHVYAAPGSVIVQVTDTGTGGPIVPPPTPDLDAKLAGEQSPRGWGLFLIQNMVDEMHITNEENCHRVELIVQRGERT